MQAFRVEATIEEAGHFKQSPSKLQFLLFWTIASSLGGAMGLIPSFIFSHYFDTMNYLFDSIGLPWPVAFQLIGFGAAIGLIQGFVLSYWVKETSWWTLATTGGWTLGAFIAMGSALQLGEVVMFGLLLGISQWLVLRHWIRGAWWWIPANGVAWFVAFGVGFEVGIRLFGEQSYIIFGGLVGAVVGVMTGLVLAWLLKPSAQKSIQTPLLQ